MDNETKSTNLLRILSKFFLAFVLVVVVCGGFILYDSGVYSKMQEEQELRDKVESITPVGAEIISIENVPRRRGSLYLVELKFEDIVSTIRTSTLRNSDGKDITEGTMVTVHLWEFTDGTAKLRLEDGTEKIRKSLLRY